MFIEIDGEQTFCSTGGREYDAAQPNIVFIHGAALDNTVWTLFARYYARRGYNVFALDLPGNGHSQGMPIADVEGMASWVARIMDALSIEQASVVGHSMGSLIGLQMAGTLGDRVQRVALVSVALPMGVAPPFLEAAKSNAQSAIDMFCLYGVGYAAQLGCNPIAGVNVLNSSVRLVERASKGIMYAGLNACDKYRPAQSTLEAVRCPVTIIQGEEDMMTPLRSANKLASNLADCEVVQIGECGHMCMSEKPEETHRALQHALLR